MAHHFETEANKMEQKVAKIQTDIHYWEQTIQQQTKRGNNKLMQHSNALLLSLSEQLSKHAATAISKVTQISESSKAHHEQYIKNYVNDVTQSLKNDIEDMTHAMPTKTPQITPNKHTNRNQCPNRHEYGHKGLYFDKMSQFLLLQDAAQRISDKTKEKLIDNYNKIAQEKCTQRPKRVKDTVHQLYTDGLSQEADKLWDQYMQLEQNDTDDDMSTSDEE
jgi:hypothetical protein